MCWSMFTGPLQPAPLFHALSKAQPEEAACTLCTCLQACSEQIDIPHPAPLFRAENTAENSDLGCTDTAASPGFRHGCEARLLWLSSAPQRRGGRASQLGTLCRAGSTACSLQSPFPRRAENPLLLAVGCAGTQPGEPPARRVHSPGLLQLTGTGAQGAACHPRGPGLCSRGFACPCPSSTAPSGSAVGSTKLLLSLPVQWGRYRELGVGL